jgi:3-hydroxybutyryl-CoA dehydrogenase
MVSTLNSHTPVAVIGLGTMGRKIVRLLAASGFTVTTMSRNKESGLKHLDEIKKDVESKVSKGRLTREEADCTMSRIRLTDSHASLKDSMLVIEAVTEDVDAKISLYKQIEPFLPRDAVVATNTSSLSITELSKGLKNPDRFVGMHFFNPPDVLKLVEVKGSPSTAKSVLDAACEMARMVGRTPLVVPDEPGYYVNRVLFPLIIEGIKIVESSGADPKDVDSALKLGANLPMGPLELADYIGNDIVLSICGILKRRTNESKFDSPNLLVKMVDEGRLGRKSGHGFYKY